MIYNSSSPGIIDEEEVNKIIPSPSELAKMEYEYSFLKRFGVYDLTSTGARAFLKLGRDDDAYERHVSPCRQSKRLKEDNPRGLSFDPRPDRGQARQA